MTLRRVFRSSLCWAVMEWIPHSSTYWETCLGSYCYVPSCLCWCFLHRQNTGWSRSHVPVQGGIVNYKAHYSLSWFRPLLEGNSPTSSSLILKMNNNGYNGVSRELEKFAK
jgi:hypothetical protein